MKFISVNCFVFYKIYHKTFLSYNNYLWKFIENYFSKEGKIKNECNIYFKF